MRMRQYGDTHVHYVDFSSLVRWLCAMVVPAVILGSGRVLCSKPTVGRLVGRLVGAQTGMNIWCTKDVLYAIY